MRAILAAMMLCLFAGSAVSLEMTDFSSRRDSWEERVMVTHPVYRPFRKVIQPCPPWGDPCFQEVGRQRPRVVRSHRVRHVRSKAKKVQVRYAKRGATAAKRIAAIPLPRPRPEIGPELGVTPKPITPADKENIFRRYLEGKLQPAPRCREWQQIDVRVRRVVSDAATHFGGTALMTSCYRSYAYNKQIYARRGRRPTRSLHIQHKAIDFMVHFSGTTRTLET